MRADPQTEQAVLDVLDRFTEAVATREPERVLALFAGDEDVCSIGSEAGELVRGPGQVAEFLDRILTGPSRYSFEWLSRRVSAEGAVAWLVAEGVSRIERAAAAETSPYRLSAVLVRREGSWRIALFHGSEPVAGRAERRAVE